MSVLRYSDLQGNWFLEIISREYNALKALQEEHLKMNRKTWFNLFNSCQGEWVLTVKMS